MGGCPITPRMAALKVILMFALIWFHQSDMNVYSWEGDAFGEVVLWVNREIVGKHINPMFTAAAYIHVVDKDRGDFRYNIKGLWHRYARHVPLLFFASLVFLYHQPSMQSLGVRGKWVMGKQQGLCRPWDAADPGGLVARTLGLSSSSCYNIHWWQTIWAGGALLTVMTALPLQWADVLNGAVLLVIASSLVHLGQYNSCVFVALLVRVLRRSRVVFGALLIAALLIPSKSHDGEASAFLSVKAAWAAHVSAALVICIMHPGQHADTIARNGCCWTCLKMMAFLAPSVNLLHVPLREYITFYTDVSSSPTQLPLDALKLAALTWIFSLILNLLVLMPAQRLIDRATALAALSMQYCMPHNVGAWKRNSKQS